jgi:hypothetical protein
MSADQYNTKKPVFEPTIEEIAVAAVKDAYVAHGYRACLEILEGALNRIHVIETARRSPAQETIPEHVCGLQGFDPMKGDECKGCYDRDRAAANR